MSQPVVIKGVESEATSKLRTSLVPRPSSKEERRVWQSSTSTHYGLVVAMVPVKAKPLKSLAGLQ